MCSCDGTTWKLATRPERPLPRLGGGRRRPHVRRTRGARHPLPRGAREVGAEPRPEELADAVPLDDQSVPRMFSHACTFCFARPTHTYLDLDAGRDFEREIVVKVNVPEVARAELVASVVEARARRARDEHRSVPVGREPLQADARHLAGAARHRHPVLAGHEVAAGAARHRHPERARRGPGRVRLLLGADARREGLARDRAPHPLPARAARRGAQDERGRRAVRDPHRAADPGHQRRARAGRRDHAHRRGQRGDQHGDRAAPPAWRGARHLVRLAAHVPAGPHPALRGAVQARRVRPERGAQADPADGRQRAARGTAAPPGRGPGTARGRQREDQAPAAKPARDRRASSS